MIYAKCIRKSQVALSNEEFHMRQAEEYHVYCEGETTYAKQGMDTLCCVPLNYIFDCLKYGECIAVVEIEDTCKYPKSGNYTSHMLTMTEQKILRIFDSTSYEAIDFVFNEVKDPAIIHSGYLSYLPPEMQRYFRQLQTDFE